MGLKAFCKDPWSTSNFMIACFVIKPAIQNIDCQLKAVTVFEYRLTYKKPSPHRKRVSAINF